MKFGWLPDHLDHRDKLYSINRFVPLQSKLLMDIAPATYDQGSWSSCGANAGAALVYSTRLVNKQPLFLPSRMFLYQKARLELGAEFLSVDSGCMLRDIMKSLQKWGIPPESAWDYDVDHFASTPPAEVNVLAEDFQALQYQSMDGSLASILSCLGEGYPFIFGMTICDNFIDGAGSSGYMPPPTNNIVGRHAVTCYGIDIILRCCLVLNSWGNKWGNSGFFWMPEEIITNPNQCSDFWTLRSME